MAHFYIDLLKSIYTIIWP